MQAQVQSTVLNVPLKGKCTWKERPGQGRVNQGWWAGLGWGELGFGDAGLGPLAVS